MIADRVWVGKGLRAQLPMGLGTYYLSHHTVRDGERDRRVGQNRSQSGSEARRRTLQALTMGTGDRYL
jgi:hypothetical protein